MSRGEDRKKLFKKGFVLAFAIVCIGLIIFLFVPQKKAEQTPYKPEEGELPFSELEIRYAGGGELEIRAALSKEKLFDILSERGVKLSVFESVLPDNLEVFCMCGIKRTTEDEILCLSIKKAELNGISIPTKLLFDTGEIKLDFKRSLVYN